MLAEDPARRYLTVELAGESSCGNVSSALRNMASLLDSAGPDLVADITVCTANRPGDGTAVTAYLLPRLTLPRE